MDKIISRRKFLKYIPGAAAAPLILASCGKDDSSSPVIPPPPDTTGPTIADLVNDSYEGLAAVSADVSDPSGVQSAEFQYRAAGSADPYTIAAMANSGGNTWTADVNFASDEFEYKIAAVDTKGNPREVTGNVRKWANETNGDAVLEAKLNQYLNESAEVLDYGVNDSKGVDIEGTLIYPDYWALIEDPSHSGDPDFGHFVVGWYQGESDGDHVADKQACDDYFVPWAQINACPQYEIAGKLDEIRAAGWVSGQVKAKTLEKKVEEVPEEVF